MPFTTREHQQIDHAKTLPADVLAEAVKYQARQSLMSEAGCLGLVAAYQDAAAIARQRRIDSQKYAPQMVGGFGLK